MRSTGAILSKLAKLNDVTPFMNRLSTLGFTPDRAEISCEVMPECLMISRSRSVGDGPRDLMGLMFTRMHSLV